MFKKYQGSKIQIETAYNFILYLFHLQPNITIFLMILPLLKDKINNTM